MDPGCGRGGPAGGGRGRRGLPEERRPVVGARREPHRDHDRGGRGRRPDHGPHLQRGAHRGGTVGAPGVRGARGQAVPHGCQGLDRTRRLGVGPGPRHAGPRRLLPGALRVPGRSARERGAGERPGQRPLGERGGGLPRAGLREVRGRLDHAGRARGDPARARLVGAAGERAPPGGGGRARGRGARAGGGSTGAGGRGPGGRGAGDERGSPAVYGWGVGPISWRTTPAVTHPIGPRPPAGVPR
jgi:translation initiation factor IF-2